MLLQLVSPLHQPGHKSNITPNFKSLSLFIISKSHSSIICIIKSLSVIIFIISNTGSALLFFSQITFTFHLHIFWEVLIKQNLLCAIAALCTKPFVFILWVFIKSWGSILLALLICTIHQFNVDLTCPVRGKTVYLE